MGLCNRARDVCLLDKMVSKTSIRPIVGVTVLSLFLSASKYEGFLENPDQGSIITCILHKQTRKDWGWAGICRMGGGVGLNLVSALRGEPRSSFPSLTCSPYSNCPTLVRGKRDVVVGRSLSNGSLRWVPIVLERLCGGDL